MENNALKNKGLAYLSITNIMFWESHRSKIILAFQYDTNIFQDNRRTQYSLYCDKFDFSQMMRSNN